MIALFVLGVLFVVFLIWIILSIILYKFINIKLIENNKKKLPKYIGFPLSAFIVVFITSCFTSGWGWFVPYSFQPSYHKFKEICKLDPEIYQANGGKLDEEYYNKVLKYFDTSLDTLDWEYIQENLFFNGKKYGYKFNKYDGRISATLFFMFKDNRASFNNINNIWSAMTWRDLRPLPAGNEGSGFYLSGGRVGCFEALHIDMTKFNEWERGIGNVK